MNYELAKKLKEVGFPQAKKEQFPIYITENNKAPMQIPTLSELIKACGDINLVIWKYNKKWIAGIYRYGDEIYIDDYPHPSEEGSIPEEAVAKLWLYLNEKK